MSHSKVNMENLGRRSSTGRGISLWMPPPLTRTTMPSHEGAPNRPQQFIMPHLVGEGRNGEEGGLDLHRRRVVPPSGFRCQLPQKGFVDGIDEEEDEPFCGMSCFNITHSTAVKCLLL
jgi:hypothetical protein